MSFNELITILQELGSVLKYHPKAYEEFSEIQSQSLKECQELVSMTQKESKKLKLESEILQAKSQILQLELIPVRQNIANLEQENSIIRQQIDKIQKMRAITQLMIQGGQDVKDDFFNFLWRE
ncbi:hypothetical protein SS50377_20991 [Spironucleus salmonicida]|uniref:Uncharacterized protein n=1 Tax=Spironucleus salmonicida TaxID=348837 RepID=V6LHA1_9EUKA|nr:hypothetical protein SS50377_20991 [Spironucleus salmonicida]|eukprot:EST43658.1 Hypothetical protein SS50377_16701 [Spironucleus salmonicida]